MLDAVVNDFPFARPAHRSAWLAGLLTLLARTAFSGPVPLFLVDGNVRGAGKGLLVDVIGLSATGDRFPLTPYTPDREEFRRQITSWRWPGSRRSCWTTSSGRSATRPWTRS